MHDRAQTVTDGVGNHTIDLGIGTDGIVMINLSHLLKTKLPWCQRALMMESRIGKGGSEFPGQQS